MCRSWSFIPAWSRKQKILVLSFGLLDFAGFCCLSILAPFFPHEVRKILFQLLPLPLTKKIKSMELVTMFGRSEGVSQGDERDDGGAGVQFVCRDYCFVVSRHGSHRESLSCHGPQGLS